MNIQQARKTVAANKLNGVVNLLEALGSSQDPIIYQGQETTPEDLSYKLGWDADPTQIRISFYGEGKRGGVTLRRNSTFAQMLLDRVRMKQERIREEKRQDRKPVVEYLVTWKEWNGIEPCGRTDWDIRSKRFKSRAEAKRFYQAMGMQHPTTFKKITTEFIGSLND